MSVEVGQFLSDSGGNFTESSARPPVPGEENDRQSNGGTSTRSSGSHKSHSSGKSTSSQRGNVGEKSPAVTPRRSNLDKSLPPTSSTAVWREEDAPLGFEPEGSAANSPSFNEHDSPKMSPPPCFKWAENLNYLLEDNDGVLLYLQFLKQEQCADNLKFWLACKGLKEVKPTEKEQIKKYTNIIYKSYIRKDRLKLGLGLTKPIQENWEKKNFDYDQTIFDHAQAEAERNMREESYPLFLKSDLYIQYVQHESDSPKSDGQGASNPSSGSSSVRPHSGLLPTLPEGEVLTAEDLNDSAKEMPPPSMPPALLNRCPRAVGLSYPESTAPRPITSYGGYFRSSSSSSGRSAQYDSAYLTTSVQESEVQSLSSDALTDDTMSLTDTSSVDGGGRAGGDMHHGSRHHHHQHHRGYSHHKHRIRKSLKLNRHADLSSNIIPRTEILPKERNMAEKDPMMFGTLLIEKLEKYLKDKHNMHKIKNMPDLSLSETSDVVVDSHQTQQPVAVQQTQPSASSSSAQHQQQQQVLASAASLPQYYNMSLNQSAASNTSASFSFNPASADSTAASGGDFEDSAQSILEAHMSRVWESSAGQTPSRSPGRHSPDRLGGAVGPSRGAAAAAYGGGGAYGIYGGNTNTPNVSSTSFNLSVMSSASKGHHHSSKRSRDKDLSAMNLSATSTGAPRMLDTSYPGGDHVMQEKRQQHYPTSYHYTSIDSEEALQGHYKQQQRLHHHQDTSSLDAMHNVSGASAGGSRRSMGPPPVPQRTYGHHWPDDTARGSRAIREDSRRGGGGGSSKKVSADVSSNIDSGIGLDQLSGNYPSDATRVSVMMWMLDSEKYTGDAVASGSTDNSERSSSHKRSAVAGGGAGGHGKGKKSGSGGQYSSSRSGSLERSHLGSAAGGMMPSSSGGVAGASSVSGGGSVAPGGPDYRHHHPAQPMTPGGAVGGVAAGAMMPGVSSVGTSVLLPGQPIATDPAMPLLGPPNTATQLEEARRRLEDPDHRRVRTSRSFQGVPMKGGMGGGVASGGGSTRMKAMVPGAPVGAAAPPGSLGINPLTGSAFQPQDDRLDSSMSKSSKKSASVPTTPLTAPLSTSQLASPANTSTTSQAGGGGADTTVVVFYLGDDKIPYRITIPHKHATLGIFKQHAKHGNYRYYFKKVSNEFDAGAVMEEISDDSAVLPLWDNKVVAKLQKIE